MERENIFNLGNYLLAGCHLEVLLWLVAPKTVPNERSTLSLHFHSSVGNFRVIYMCLSIDFLIC